MCRSTLERAGGRRCPSHSNPIAVSERNARRREQYKAKVGTRKVKTPEDYGFQPVDGIRTMQDSDAVYKESLKEVSRLYNDGLADGIAKFTSNAYKWINGALYGKKALMNAEALSLPSHSYSRTASADDLRESVSAMDEAFLTSPLHERVTYRGKRINTERFKGSGLTTAEYIAENYALGSEVVFDGYQSTTLDPEVAADYANTNGLLFEMKSSSGLNVTSISQYDMESEVLLPRSTRWKVVGVSHDIQYLYKSPQKQNVSSETVTLIQMVEIDANGNELSERAAPPPLTEKQTEEHEWFPFST